MSDLIVIAFDDPHRAEQVRAELRTLQREQLIDLEDAVVARRKANGDVSLDQTHNITAQGAATGGFWGTLIGLIFLSPLFGLGAGVLAGAAAGALTDVGIDDRFMKELSSTLRPGSSALFVLVRKATPDRVLENLHGYGGTVLRTSLSHEDEERLQRALNEVSTEARDASAAP